MQQLTLPQRFLAYKHNFRRHGLPELMLLHSDKLI